MSDCLFCKIISGEIPSTKVHEDDATFAFLDINPASDGHLLVLPKRHSKDLFDIPDEDLVAVTLTAKKLAQRVTDVLGAEGVNLLNNRGQVAWQSVFHFHLHVIPRYADKARDRMRLPHDSSPGDMDTIRAIGAQLALP